METVNKKQTPSPQQRPDLYDDFDGIERPEGYQTGVKTPDYIQQMIDAKGGSQDTKKRGPAAEVGG